MATLLNEDTQFVSNGGIPLTGGKIYIGEVDQDPVLNPKAIFSDRELTLALANPQTIDSTGRSTNKIWTDGKYSLQVNDINGVQVFQDLDRGENSASIGILGLSSIVGGNTITAVSSPVSTSYVDKLLYIFTAAQANTGPTTINIDNIGAKSIVQNNNSPLSGGRIQQNDNVVLCYSAANDNFAIVSQKTNLISYRTTATSDIVDPADIGIVIDCTSTLTLTLTAAATLGNGWSFYAKANGGIVTIDPNAAETIDGAATRFIPDGTQALITCDGSNFHTTMISPVFTQGSDVATATEALVLQDGDSFRFSGTTTVAGIETTADAWPIWSTIRIQAIGAFTLTHSAALSLLGSADIRTAANDVFVMEKYASGSWRMISYTAASGASLKSKNRSYTRSATQFTIATAIPGDDTIPQISEGTQVLSASITPTSTLARLRITVKLFVGGGNVQRAAALFQNSNVNALASGLSYTNIGVGMIEFDYEFVPASVALQTFTVRAGPTPSGTIYINLTETGLARFGNTMASSITVEEV